MLHILVVCTGNICRSPLAAQILTTRLGSQDASVSSAGTHAREGTPPTPDTLLIGRRLGLPADRGSWHTSRLLNESLLRKADLVLTMTRDHRRMVVEMCPASSRYTFTIREFGRLGVSLSDDDLLDAVSFPARNQIETSGGRLAAVLQILASRRGLTPPPLCPEDYDVIDPFGRSVQTYERAASEMAQGVSEAERVIRIALG